MPPTNGPIQEKDTKTKVKAIKKIPTSPPLSDFLSIELTNFEGKVISKNPRREKPNTINKIKNSRLRIQFDNKSVATPGPNRIDKISPISNKIKEIQKDKTFIEKILDTSEKKANKIANDNLVKIKNTIGLI